MLLLGVETSCDETAAAVVEDGRRVRSNAVASQFHLHREYGGVVPEIASRAHAERIVPVVREALRVAGVALSDIGAVAVGNRPGLIGSLLVGVAAAKALAWSLGVPVVAVDHVHAHLYAGLLDPAEERRPRGAGREPADATRPVAGAPLDPPTAASAFPALGLVVSGGHTSLYRCRSPVDLERLGATIDDAMGEAFDKAAAILGLPYPGGPNLDREASRAGANDRAHAFPVSRLAPGSLDFSFSGLKTSLLYAVRGTPGPGGVFPRGMGEVTAERRSDLAASFQRAAVRAVILKLDRALAALEERGLGRPGTLLTGGGVTANSRLRRELVEWGASRGVEVRLPAMGLCLDNAAMIAGLGYHLLRAGREADLSMTATPTTGD